MDMMKYNFSIFLLNKLGFCAANAAAKATEVVFTSLTLPTGFSSPANSSKTSDLVSCLLSMVSHCCRSVAAITGGSSKGTRARNSQAGGALLFIIPPLTGTCPDILCSTALPHEVCARISNQRRLCELRVMCRSGGRRSRPSRNASVVHMGSKSL